MKQDVLIFGGLGNPQSSVVRLYEGLLNQLKQKFSLIAIDPLAALTPSIESSSYYHFPYAEQYESYEHYLHQASDRSIACVMILTPVGTHLSILEQVDRTQAVCDCLFVIEKPSFSLDEIDDGFKNVLPRLKSKGAKFYFIDTVIVSPVFDYFFSSNEFRALGLPEKIVAVATDNPISIDKNLEEYSFESRIKYLNARRLLNLDLSGGGGFGFDMGIHAIAGLVRYLQKMALFDAQIELINVTAECLKEPRLNRSSGAETHIYASGKIQSLQASCDLFIDAGKASDFWDRRLELHYPDYVVVLGFGTLKHPPYIWLSDQPDSDPITFDVLNSGYSKHFNDILSSLGFDVSTIVSNEESERLMSKSMELLHELFITVGESYAERESQLEWVEIHCAQKLTEEDTLMYLKLNKVLDRLASR